MKIKINFNKINIFKIIKSLRHKYLERSFNKNRLKHIQSCKDEVLSYKLNKIFYLEEIALSNKSLSNTYSPDEFHLFYNCNNIVGKKVCFNLYYMLNASSKKLSYTDDMLFFIKTTNEYKSNVLNMIERCKRAFITHHLTGYHLKYTPYKSKITYKYRYIIYIDDYKLVSEKYNNKDYSFYDYIKEGVILENNAGNIIFNSFDEMIKYIDEINNISTSYDYNKHVKKEEKILKEIVFLC